VPSAYFTDLRNAMSNRCYANIGFRPYCDYALYLRAERRGPDD
jgi:predicted GNAT family acetyltransferase